MRVEGWIQDQGVVVRIVWIVGVQRQQSLVCGCGIDDDDASDWMRYWRGNFMVLLSDEGHTHDYKYCACTALPQELTNQLQPGARPQGGRFDLLDAGYIATGGIF